MESWREEDGEGTWLGGGGDVAASRAREEETSGQGGGLYQKGLKPASRSVLNLVAV